MILNPPDSTLVLLAGLLQQQLGLANNRVYLYNQKWNIPPDDGLFIVVNFTGEKVFSSTYQTVNNPVTGNLDETKTTNVRETYTVNLFSRNAEAVQRKHEITFAVHSTAAQQLAEKYSLQFAPVPTFVTDTSSLEASAELNRTSITLQILRAYSQTNTCQFYDTFSEAALITNP